jgi:hypothetical protein
MTDTTSSAAKGQDYLSEPHIAVITLIGGLADVHLVFPFSMGGREKSLEETEKSGVSDAKAEAEGVAAQAQSVAADAKAKGKEVVENVKGKLS